jgi:hypothetical protein
MNPLNPGDYPINSTTIDPAGATGPIPYIVAGIVIILAGAALAYVSVRAVRIIRRR